MKVAGLAVGLIAGMVGMAALAQDGGPKPLLPGDVELRRAPDIEARFRYFPDAARQQQIEGRGTVVCRVQDDGKLRDCTVKAEAPEGHGFGEATKRLVEAEIQLGRKARDGSPTAGREFQVTRLFALRNPRETAQTAPLDPGRVGEDGLRRRWIRPPDSSQLYGCFRRAIPSSEDARIKLQCVSTADDRLADCKAVENSKAPDARYEAAAVCALGSARYRVEDKDGKPVTGAEITVPLSYRKP
ncbi:MAG: hypothetical protein AB1942_05640 [Pseudomonadota bacterium]